MADWIEYTQSVVVGLIVSFLLAKLFSIVFSSGDENLSSTGTNPNETLPYVISPDSRRKLAVADKRSGAESSKKHSSGREKELLLIGDQKKSVVTVVDSDDDWEGVETTELDASFCSATEFVAAIAADRSAQKVSNSLRLKLYGLYKVATEGACRVPQPSAIKITARAKWNAWHKLDNMSQEEAMQKYLEIITELYPNWADGSTSMRSGGGNNETSSKDTRSMGPEFSSFVHDEEFKLNDVHDFAREDQTPMHSAVDRDQTDVAETLSSRNAATGIQDDEAVDGGDDDDDGTVYPSDLSHSNWQSIQP